ncbi:hypothetical protein Vretimale_9861, partial [Volvox reticuliferus]
LLRPPPPLQSRFPRRRCPIPTSRLAVEFRPHHQLLQGARYPNLAAAAAPAGARLEFATLLPLPWSQPLVVVAPGLDQKMPGLHGADGLFTIVLYDRSTTEIRRQVKGADRRK